MDELRCLFLLLLRGMDGGESAESGDWEERVRGMDWVGVGEGFRRQLAISGGGWLMEGGLRKSVVEY